MAESVNIKALGLAAGVIGGGYQFLAALLEMGGVHLWMFNSEAFKLLQVFHPGISATVPGAVIGLVGGFVCAGVGFAVGGWIYNQALARAS